MAEIVAMTFEPDILSACPRPEGSWIWNPGGAHHDDSLLHRHHGMGPLLPLPGSVVVHRGPLVTMRCLSLMLVPLGQQGCPVFDLGLQ